jgi:hypothetical protein
VNRWDHFEFRELGGAIAGASGFGLAWYQRWQDRRDACRDRGAYGALELNEPLLRLRVEFSLQLEQGPGHTRGLMWVNGARDIGSANTWRFGPGEIPNPLDWTSVRELAQAFERTWTDRLRIQAFDSVIRSKVKAVRLHARAGGFMASGIRVSVTALSEAPWSS